MVISKVNIVKNIVFFSFMANGYLGYGYTNILIGPLPLNEILLLLSLVIMNKYIFIIILKYQMVIPLITWSLAYMFLSVPFGFMEHGIWAGRDATHLIEIWWVVVVLYVFDKIDIKQELKKALKVMSILFIFKVTIILLGDHARGIFVIQGAQGEIDILASSTGLNLILFVLLFSWFIGLLRKILNLILSLILISLLQSRTIYIGLISSIGFYILLHKFKIIKILKIIFGASIMIVLLYFISMMTFLDEYTRFGIESIAPHKIFLHLMSSFGESEEYASSAHGTTQRIEWFLINWNKAMNDSFVLWFGQGFGIPLTNFNTLNIVREPHNSYLSIFSRTGLFGLLLWLIFHVYINTKAFFTLIKYRKEMHNNEYLKYLFVSFFTMHSMYWFSLVEPGFESPQTAINFYILLGLMAYILKGIKEKKLVSS